MNTTQVIENIIYAANLVEEATNSEAYINLIYNHPDISSLNKKEKFLDLLDSSEVVPLSEDLYTRATELTKGMVADLNEELEEDL
jgi:hypothetical protein